MKNSFKKITKYLSLVLLIFLCATPAMAADNDRLGSIYLDFCQCTVPLTAVDCRLYQITTIDENGVQTLNETYSSINVDLDSLTNASYWQAFSENLENFINFYMITPDLEFSTDEDGNYFIDDLEWGIYYIQIDHVHDDDEECDYYPEPVLIMIGTTGTEDTDVNDEFTVVPKVLIIYEEPEEPDTPDDPDDSDDDDDDDDPEEPEDDPEEPADDEPDTPEEREIPEDSYKPYNLTLKKVWENTSSDLVILDSIDVEIRCNGVSYTMVQLSEANGWTYTWQDYDKDNVWAVQELTILENFSTNYESEQFEFTITNIYDVPDIPEELIETGYYGYLVPTFASLGVVSILLGLILKGKSKKPKVKG